MSGLGRLLEKAQRAGEGQHACGLGSRQVTFSLAFSARAAVEGVQNWTCDPTTGNYSYAGWLVNATDAKAGTHTGMRGSRWAEGLLAAGKLH